MRRDLNNSRSQVHARPRCVVSDGRPTSRAGGHRFPCSSSQYYYLLIQCNHHSHHRNHRQQLFRSVRSSPLCAQCHCRAPCRRCATPTRHHFDAVRLTVSLNLLQNHAKRTTLAPTAKASKRYAGCIASSTTTPTATWTSPRAMR